MSTFLLLTGKFVITGGADGSVFISKALPDRLAIPAPPVPESGPVYDVDSPDESMQHDEVRKPHAASDYCRSGSCVLLLRMMSMIAHRGAVLGVAIPDGRLIFVADRGTCEEGG